MKIFIYTKDFKWAGGIDLLHNIVLGLLNQDKRAIKIFILIDENGVRDSLSVKTIFFIQQLPQRLQNIRRSIRNLIKRSKVLKSKTPTSLDILSQGFNYFSYVHEVFQNEQVEFVYYNSKVKNSLNSVLKTNNATVLLPVLFQDELINCTVPKVGYIFDFVYKHMPYLYTTDFCLEMDISFAKTIKYSKAVIVNSQKTAKDAMHYFPYKKEVFVTMPFAPYANRELYERALEDKIVFEKYNITKSYFIICNQLWLHKDHETAFKALRVVLDKTKEDLSIICTGTLTDLSGTNDRYDELKNFVVNNDLESHVKFLGHIPKQEQLTLMLHSLALIQPTKFEGGPGGGSVYMSTAYGIESIISDIDVNKEIKSESLISFFQVSNYESLAAEMIKYINKKRVFLLPESIVLKNKTALQALGETVVLSIDKALS